LPFRARYADFLLAQGARHLSFGPPLGPDPEAAIAVLGGEVLPSLTSARAEDQIG